MCVDFDSRKTTENVVFDLNILESKEDLVCEQNSSLFSWVKGFAHTSTQRAETTAYDLGAQLHPVCHQGAERAAHKCSLVWKQAVESSSKRHNAFRAIVCFNALGNKKGLNLQLSLRNYLWALSANNNLIRLFGCPWSQSCNWLKMILL